MRPAAGPPGLQHRSHHRAAVRAAARSASNGATVSRYCASSLESIRQAANAIVAGQGDAYIAAGVEWVSRYNERSRGGRRPQDQNEKLQGKNGDPDAYISMGLTAENVAERYEVSRADMDKYAQRSQELAVQSQESGFFDREIVPGDAAGRHRGREGRRPARQLDAREALAARSGVQGGRQGHRRQLVPAERRRRRGARDVGHQGQGARPQAARADHHAGDGRRTSPSTWASRRSARSRRCSSAPA